MMYNLIERLYLRQKDNLAFYDSLTKAYNRNWFEINAKKRFHDKEIYITIVDLNNLKETNDSLGHEMGDERLRKFVRSMDRIFNQNLLCRLDGDEFVLFTYDNPTLELKKLCIFENFSFGTYYKTKEETVSYACKQADRKMYEMKLKKLL